MIQLPTDFNSWMSFFTKAIASVVGLVALMHPGFHVPKQVPVIVPSVSMLCVALEQAIHNHTHTKAKIAAITSAARQAIAVSGSATATGAPSNVGGGGGGSATS